MSLSKKSSEINFHDPVKNLIKYGDDEVEPLSNEEEFNP
jgi:hypothetical protein